MEGEVELMADEMLDFWRLYVMNRNPHACALLSVFFFLERSPVKAQNPRLLDDKQLYTVYGQFYSKHFVIYVCII